MLISASRLRNSDVLVSRFRISPSLCWTSGWRISTTCPVGATLFPVALGTPAPTRLDQLELRAAPGHVFRARGADRHRRGVRRGGTQPGHRRSVHDPAVARLVPR